MWRKREKLEFLAGGKVAWCQLTPDGKQTWIVPEHADEYETFLAMGEMFKLRSRGLQTARDAVACDWSRDNLVRRIEKFIDDYNTEVHRHKANPKADWPDRIDWSRDLKQDAQRGNPSHPFLQ